MLGWDGTNLTIRNPHGHHSGQVPAQAQGFTRMDGGRFQMSLALFDSVFFEITYEE